jgi:hypothetical protein
MCGSNSCVKHAVYGPMQPIKCFENWTFFYEQTTKQLTDDMRLNQIFSIHNSTTEKNRLNILNDCLLPINNERLHPVTLLVVCLPLKMKLLTVIVLIAVCIAVIEVLLQKFRFF